MVDLRVCEQFLCLQGLQKDRTTSSPPPPIPFPMFPPFKRKTSGSLEVQMWFLNLCQWGRSSVLLEMVCSHSFLYFISPSSQETQTSREGKPQMTLVHIIAKNGGCLKKGCYLTCVAWFLHLFLYCTCYKWWQLLQDWWHGMHTKKWSLFLWSLVCSPNPAEFSLPVNMAGLEEGMHLLLLL